MGESKRWDGASRIKEINAAREKIGEDPFLVQIHKLSTHLSMDYAKKWF